MSSDGTQPVPRRFAGVRLGNRRRRGRRSVFRVLVVLCGPVRPIIPVFFSVRRVRFLLLLKIAHGRSHPMRSFLVILVVGVCRVVVIADIVCIAAVATPRRANDAGIQEHLIQKNEREKERKIKRVSDLRFARSIEQTERERESERKKNISRERQKIFSFASTSRFLPLILLPCCSSSDDTRGTPRATTRRSASSLPFRVVVVVARCSQMCSRLRVRARACASSSSSSSFVVWVTVTLSQRLEVVGVEMLGCRDLCLGSERNLVICAWGNRKRLDCHFPPNPLKFSKKNLKKKTRLLIKKVSAALFSLSLSLNF